MENTFENIKDMDALREYIESIKSSLSEEEYELILYVSGLLENRGIYETIHLQGKEVKIDRYITPMIVYLNEHNIPTLACCSGLQEEHLNSKYKPDTGYLALKYDQNLLNYLQDTISNPIVSIHKSSCYFQPSVSITIKTKDDQQLKELWTLVWEVLKKWSTERTEKV